jgi:hypothetical protein
MKKLQLLMAVAATAFVLSLGGTALAQPQDGGGGGFGGGPGGGGFGGFQNMDPQQIQSMMQAFQNVDPQILQDMRQQFMNMDPQQQQDLIQQFQNMDPQQMQDAIQQRVSATFREQMGVTNDADWSLIEQKINAVTKARAAVMADVGGMRGGFFGGGRAGGLQASLTPEAQALQQAVDDDAPAAQIKDLLAKLETARQAKQAALVSAQEDLRSVLTIRQEAIALLHGLLD